MKKALVQNAADEKQVKAAEEALRLKEFKEADVWKKVLGTADGRKLVRNILSLCRLEESSVEGESVHRTYFNEGVRAVGIALKEKVKDADFESYLLMLREEHEEENA